MQNNLLPSIYFLSAKTASRRYVIIVCNKGILL